MGSLVSVPSSSLVAFPFAGRSYTAHIIKLAAFSFAGTELIGLAASETPNPRQAMPGAVKGTFWRVVSSIATDPNFPS